MGKIIWICVGAVIVWAGTILLMHRIQTKKIKKLEDDYREKQRVQQKLREEYSVKVQNKQAKIAALQSQINPHFLYNTLECIRSEALLYECDSIARMAKALAAFFRYSISNKENIVTIRDELRNIENYFLIQSYRFENKFALEINVEDDRKEVGNYLIPKLSLQPIVENAIFHGLETKAENGKVTIRIYTTDQELVVVISDNGTGIDWDTLVSMRQALEQTEEYRESVSGANGQRIITSIPNASTFRRFSSGESKYGRSSGAREKTTASSPSFFNSVIFRISF